MGFEDLITYRFRCTLHGVLSIFICSRESVGDRGIHKVMIGLYVVDFEKGLDVGNGNSDHIGEEVGRVKPERSPEWM